MKTMHRVTIACLFGFVTTAALADDPSTAKQKTARPPAGAVATPAASSSPIKMSQQDKMRLCAKQATGKKGPERKQFMKGCLSNKA